MKKFIFYNFGGGGGITSVYFIEAQNEKEAKVIISKKLGVDFNFIINAKRLKEIKSNFELIGEYFLN
ncbi:MAG: hypothetical protein V3574_04350 [Candidatus Moraniibacteriota bacterium]